MVGIHELVVHEAPTTGYIHIRQRELDHIEIEVFPQGYVNCNSTRSCNSTNCSCHRNSKCNRFCSCICNCNEKCNCNRNRDCTATVP